MQLSDYNKTNEFLVQHFNVDTLFYNPIFLSDTQLYKNLCLNNKLNKSKFFEIADQYYQFCGKKYLPEVEKKSYYAHEQTITSNENPYLYSKTYSTIQDRTKELRKSQKYKFNLIRNLKHAKHSIKSEQMNKPIMYQSMRLNSQIYESPMKNNVMQNQLQQNHFNVTPKFKAYSESKTDLIQNKYKRTSGSQKQQLQRKQYKKQRSFSLDGNMAAHQLIGNTLYELRQLQQKMTGNDSEDFNDQEIILQTHQLSGRKTIVPPKLLSINITNFKKTQ